MRKKSRIAALDISASGGAGRLRKAYTQPGYIEMVEGEVCI